MSAYKKRRAGNGHRLPRRSHLSGLRSTDESLPVSEGVQAWLSQTSTECGSPVDFSTEELILGKAILYFLQCSAT
ncbi:hypothetical protein D918_01692 [Trichuris suis]|nr:hypothetical protein D918_01692 [Trichuris suis]